MTAQVNRERPHSSNRANLAALSSSQPKAEGCGVLSAALYSHQIRDQKKATGNGGQGLGCAEYLERKRLSLLQATKTGIHFCEGLRGRKTPIAETNAKQPQILPVETKPTSKNAYGDAAVVIQMLKVSDNETGEALVMKNQSANGYIHLRMGWLNNPLGAGIGGENVAFLPNRNGELFQGNGVLIQNCLNFGEVNFGRAVVTGYRHVLIHVLAIRFHAVLCIEIFQRIVCMSVGIVVFLDPPEPGAFTVGRLR